MPLLFFVSQILHFHVISLLLARSLAVFFGFSFFSCCCPNLISIVFVWIGMETRTYAHVIPHHRRGSPHTAITTVSCYMLMPMNRILRWHFYYACYYFYIFATFADAGVCVSGGRAIECIFYWLYLLDRLFGMSKVNRFIVYCSMLMCHSLVIYRWSQWARSYHMNTQ